MVRASEETYWCAEMRLDEEGPRKYGDPSDQQVIQLPLGNLHTIYPGNGDSDFRDLKIILSAGCGTDVAIRAAELIVG